MIGTASCRAAQDAANALLEFLLPRMCAACESPMSAADAGLVCGRCWSRLPLLPKPQCERCPLNTDCVAHQRGLTHLLPGKKPRAALPQRETVMLVMRNAGEILLERRPASGIWGGLWSLPEVAHERDAASTAKRHGVSVVVSKALPLIAHGFTHYKLNITPLLLEVKKSRSHAPGVPGTVWLSAEDAARAAIPTPVDRKSTRLNSSHMSESRMPSSA